MAYDAAAPEGYDSRPDILAHIDRVVYWLARFRHEMALRARAHDASKLAEPEKSMFDKFTWRLAHTEFGSEEYKAQLAEMNQTALPHHYAANRHHPEHFENGVNDMTLVDLVEMYSDWLAACQAKGVTVDLDKLAERFGIGPQLAGILYNSLVELDKVNGELKLGHPPFAPDGPQSVLLRGWHEFSADAPAE